LIAGGSQWKSWGVRWGFPAVVDNPLPAASHCARVAADRAGAQHLADFLTESLDGDETAVAAFESAGGQWTVAIYFAAPPNETAVRALVGLGAGADAANALTFERVESRDWVAASLEGLAPVAAGRFLVHGRHDRARRRSNQIGIEIEAALAFGTGHHGTTRGCLLALDFIARQKQRPRKILDVGTGTGVLAIAAAKALRMPVLASDIDRAAVLVARGNARANTVAPLVEIIHAAGLTARRFRRHGPYDVVLANILLGPLTQLARPMARLLSPGATVVLSGLLNSQAQPAFIAYRAQGLVLRRRIVLEGWTTLILRRPGLPR
jgi:ribosomal protein L11 methyltransferase